MLTSVRHAILLREFSRVHKLTYHFLEINFHSGVPGSRPFARGICGGLTVSGTGAIFSPSSLGGTGLIARYIEEPWLGNTGLHKHDFIEDV